MIVLLVLYYWFWALVGLFIHVLKSVSARRTHIGGYGLRDYFKQHPYALGAAGLFLLFVAVHHDTGVPDLLGQYLVIDDSTKEAHFGLIGYFSISILKWGIDIGATRIAQIKGNI